MKDQNLPVSLSDQSREIILGSLLGDGSLRIHKGYKNARFSFRHSVTQEDYFRWKAAALHELSGNSYIFPQHADGGYSKQPKLRYQSRALESLTEIYHLTHKGSRLHVRRKWLNMLSTLSLFIWWCDDGSIIGNGRKGVLCTDGFDRETVEMLAQYLRVVWQVQTRVGTVGAKRDGRHDTYYRLWMSTEELKKFFRIILAHLQTESLLPKFLILYYDPELQQRWISEVARLSGLPQAAIEQAVKEKKQRWKHYRE